MNPRTHAGVVLIFGGALLRLSTGAPLLRYVRPTARPVVVASAIVVTVLAAAMLVVDRRAAGAASRAAWLLLAPVVAIALIAPPALGVLTANRPPVAPPRPQAAFAALPAADPLPIRLSDVVLRTVWHAGSTLGGRELRVIGFVSRRTDHGFVLSRLVITCCAADAQPYDLDITTRLPSPTVGAWVAVTGEYRGPSPGNDLVPALRGRALALIPAPTDPYG